MNVDLTPDQARALHAWAQHRQRIAQASATAPVDPSDWAHFTAQLLLVADRQLDTAELSPRLLGAIVRDASAEPELRLTVARLLGYRS
jgi:hypothetical protein